MTAETSPDNRKYFLLLMPVLAICAAWLVLISQVRHHWGGESYYNFGWFVPFLSAWLFIRNLMPLELRPVGKVGLHLCLSFLVLLLVVPFHALSEVNPFWRLPLWIQGAGLSVFSLIVVHAVYGWKGVRASIFPLVFLSTMIPWPYRMETLIIQMLTGIVVKLAMWGLHFLGYPVVLAGNSFVLGELNIGVNEACSGIRSLQALFMVTLFLGSLFGQGKARRVAALLVLPLIVIIINTCRAVFLAVQVIVNGDEAYQAWHDPIGYITFAISMVLIYGCIELLNIGSRGEERNRIPPWPELRARLLGAWVPVSLAVMLIWPLALYGVVEGWFRYNESQNRGGTEWELALPDKTDPQAHYEEIHSQVSGLLGYSYGTRMFYRIGPKAWCEVYYYGYSPDNKLASVSSYGHSPAICMESTGATMLEEFPDLYIRVPNGPALPFKHYLFRLGDEKSHLQVFWVVWERRNMDVDPEQLQSLDYKTQVVQMLKGRRDFSRKVILISLAGIPQEEKARDAIRDLLEGWLRSKPAE